MPHLDSPRLRVASSEAGVQIPNERHMQIMIFLNSESYLTEDKIEQLECTSIRMLLQASLEIVTSKIGFLITKK